MFIPAPRILIVAGILFGGAGVACGAGIPESGGRRAWLHLNGYTHHFDAPGANARIFGLGFSWYDRQFGSPVTAWTGDIFQDSGRKLSTYVGRSWTFPLRFGSGGATAALMYHRNFSSQNSLRLMPVLLPFFETRGDRLKARLYYVPPVRSRHDHQIALQFLTPFWQLVPVSRARP